jgi:hypothetical protein
VELLVLRVGISPNAPLAIPGGGATAVARIGGEPVDDARVTLDWESVGRTDARGAVSVTLPADPTARLVVEGRDQRASTTLWPVYVPTIAACLLYLGTLAVAYRRDGTRGAVGVLAATAVVAGSALVLYGLVRDSPDVAVAGGALTVAGAGVLFWQRAHWRSATREGASDLGQFVAGVVAAATRLAYEAALAIERFVLWASARLRGLVERLRSTPRSIREVAAALAAWLARFPARLLALARWLLGTPWRILAWWRDRTGEEPTAAEPEPAETVAAPAGEPDAPFSLREAWRRFARQVLPGSWRRRTPGEVARAAISEGFPGQSVGELTDVFRDVEYGERPLTEERRERAEAAFESLQGHRRGDEEAGD